MKKLIFILVILILGLVLRLTGVNWDEGQHLNPDERFLTMVLSEMKWPGIKEFLNTSTSTYNPVNVGYSFFVYGTFPLFLNKAFAGLFQLGDYMGYLIVGRILSALFDSATILLVYLLGKKLVEKRSEMAGVLAAFIYAVAVIPIQNSHFFIVDTFGNFFGVLVIYILISLVDKFSAKKAIVLGISLGLALASKLSMILIIPAVVIGFFVIGIQLINIDKRSFMKAFGFSCLAAVSSFLIFRVAMPYAFQENTLFSFESRFLLNNKTVTEMIKGKTDFPPSIQWAGTDFIWPIQELAIWGWGLPMGFLMAFGLGWIMVKSVKEVKWKWIIVITALVVPFVYSANLVGKPQRYFLGAYPLLSIIASYLVVYHFDRKLIKAISLLIIVISLVWGVSFVSIYRHPHTRVEASRWMYEAIEPGSRIGWELWDDPLPLLVDGKNGGILPGVEMGLYDPDDERKLEEIIYDLRRADYISLSSNRLYGAIPKMPQRYPLASLYYKLLFEEKLGFVKVAEFTSYPGIWRFRIDDDFAEETFTVYDHPKVIIFKKSNNFSVDKVRAMLSKVDLAGVKNQLPREVMPKYRIALMNLFLGDDYKSE